MKDVEAVPVIASELPDLVATFLDVQHLRELVANRHNASREKTSRLGEYATKLMEIEEAVAKDVRVAVKLYPIHKWLVGLRGIDLLLAGQLIGVLARPWEKTGFSNPSKLVAYCGYGNEMVCEQCKKLYFPPDQKDARVKHVAERLQEQYEKKLVKDDGPEKFMSNASEMFCQCERPSPKQDRQRKRKGILGNWNPEAKMIVYKFGTQFVKQGAYYREVYDRRRPVEMAKLAGEIEMRAGKKTKKGVSKGTGHAHARAMRYMQKRFLVHFWVKWREADGLPTVGPYAMVHLHHADYEPPPEVPEAGGSQGRSETLTHTASHQEAETRSHIASHVVPETHELGANRARGETHRSFVNREYLEPQHVGVSHKETEPPLPVASQVINETHPILASPNSFERTDEVL
jgi:hypothetical protein